MVHIKRINEFVNENVLYGRDGALTNLYTTMERVFGKAVDITNSRMSDFMYSFIYKGDIDTLINIFKNEFKQVRAELKSSGFTVMPPTNTKRNGDDGTRLMRVKDEQGIVCDILAHRPSPTDGKLYSQYNGDLKVTLVVDNDCGAKFIEIIDCLTSAKV